MPHSGASVERERISYTKIPLSSLLMIAYELKDYPLEGPRWIFAQNYDVVAKAPEYSSRDQIHAMLQSLLVERFGLKLHRDSRDMAIFELTRGKTTLRLKRAPADGRFAAVKGHREAKGMTMPQLASFLTVWLHHPVLDKTGLTESYDFRLEMAVEEAGPASRDKASLSIFTELQEVGLNLESRNGPVEMLVVDSGNPAPAEN